MITETEKPVVSFKVGDRAQIVHLPYKNGAEIKIPAVVRQVLSGGYVIDTEFQQGIKVKSKHLEPVTV